MIFHATLQSTGKTAAGIVVPAEHVDALAAGRRPPVRVTINGHTYRSSIAARGGQYLLGVSAENRQAAGIRPGDTVEIQIELDTEPRKVSVPADLAAALDAEPEARRRFDALSYSAQQRHVLPVEQARTPETRSRRIGKTVESLRTGPPEPSRRG